MARQIGFYFGAPRKMAGLYFRHRPPYIGLWSAAAKGDRAVKPETSIIC
jgi:hypothetical protein